MALQIELVAWGGWPNCYRVSNGMVELIVTTDVGPQILSYRFTNTANVFKVFEEHLGKCGGQDWHLRGGHRLWMAPEDRVASYSRDNFPVDVQVAGDALTVTTDVEPNSGLRKQMIIRMDEQGPGVRITHRIQNCREVPWAFAIWALTVMAPGGVAVTGFPPRARHEDALLPTNPLVMWAFTDMGDPRWTFFEKYLVLRQDPLVTNPTKLGHFNRKTWGAYFLGEQLFLKRYDADPARPYPDFGCSYETFTCATMLEIETLGPLETVAPGCWIEQTEQWSLHNANLSSISADAIDRALQPLLETWLQEGTR